MRSNFVFKIRGKHGVFGLDGLQKFGERLPNQRKITLTNLKTGKKEDLMDLSHHTRIDVFDAKTGDKIIHMNLGEATTKFR